MNSEKAHWHPEILPEKALEILRDLNKISVISSFYLAGGTGLALFLGHRISHDFDFFTSEFFNEETLIQKFKGLEELTIISKEQQTVHINFKKTKISFLGYGYPLLFPLQKFDNGDLPGVKLEVADIRDIAAMKFSAVASRGTKRDFIDLYAVAQQYNLSQLFEIFKQKYAQTPYNKVHILKSLTYFDDADSEPMPDMLITISWETVKKFFTSEVPKLL
jgi:hypothetical protein